MDWTMEMERGHKNDAAVGDCFCAKPLIRMENAN